jgi:hypothetical protein
VHISPHLSRVLPHVWRRSDPCHPNSPEITGFALDGVPFWWPGALTGVDPLRPPEGHSPLVGMMMMMMTMMMMM